MLSRFAVVALVLACGCGGRSAAAPPEGGDAGEDASVPTAETGAPSSSAPDADDGGGTPPAVVIPLPPDGPMDPATGHGTEDCIVYPAGTEPDGGVPDPSDAGYAAYSVTVDSSQISGDAWHWTVANLQLGPVGGWSCPNQAVSFATSDAGAPAPTPCTVDSGLGPTVVFGTYSYMSPVPSPGSLPSGAFQVTAIPAVLSADGGVLATANSPVTAIVCTYYLSMLYPK